MIKTIVALLLLTVTVEASEIRVIAGTSLIEDIVADLTDKGAEIVTIIAGSSCPGHEGNKTTDFVFAAKADLLIIHTSQQKMSQVTGLVKAVDSKRLKVKVISPGGSWLIPDVQIRATKDIQMVLSEAFPDQADLFKERANRRIAKVQSAGADAKKRLMNANGEVASSSILREFVLWAGFAVVESFGRAEDLTPREIAQSIERLRGKPLAGVVDNYQSGADVGLPLSLELKVPHVVLSSYPGFNDETLDYFTLLNYNVRQLETLVK
ncbi:MAG: zinc ABC transporter substrate-binding protein [Deferribacteraceae bacterium]|jgi:zinc transport system substrate-binding protein|nr:zinc ABC transporter substrate-binding protein [Deferribacteraceae bacterium]